jgi:hypothetical protein
MDLLAENANGMNIDDIYTTLNLIKKNG